MHTLTRHSVIQREKNTSYIAQAEVVVKALLKENKVLEFQQRWRQHFLDTMKPRFLPELWCVDHNPKWTCSPFLIVNLFSLISVSVYCSVLFHETANGCYGFWRPSIPAYGETLLCTSYTIFISSSSSSSLLSLQMQESWLSSSLCAVNYLHASVQ